MGRQLIDLIGRLSRKALAIDVRLQSHRWTQDFEQRGGTVCVENVYVPRLKHIAAAANLTLAAAGKGDIGRIFEVDTRRSVYDKTQRKLAMFVIKNVDMDRSNEGVPFQFGIKFNFFATAG